MRYLVHYGVKGMTWKNKMSDYELELARLKREALASRNSKKSVKKKSTAQKIAELNQRQKTLDSNTLTSRQSLEEKYAENSSTLNKNLQAQKNQLNSTPTNSIRLGKMNDVRKKNLDSMKNRLSEMQKNLDKKKAAADEESRKRITEIETKIKELKARTEESRKKLKESYKTQTANIANQLDNLKKKKK